MIIISNENINDFFELTDGVLKSRPRPTTHEEIYHCFRTPKEVKVISSGCFDDLPELTHIILSDDVEEIESEAFGTNVKSIELGKSVKKLSGLSFRKSSAEKILVNKGNPYFTSFNGMLLNKARNELVYVPFCSLGHNILHRINTVSPKATSLRSKINIKIDEKMKKKTLEILQNIREIRDFGFAVYADNIINNENITKKLYDLCWPEGLEKIGFGAFIMNYFYRTMSFESGLKEIGDVAFSGCYLLQKVSLPESVEVIGKHAFSRCLKLSELDIPDRVEIVKDGICADCHDLRRVSLPEGCTSIGAEAFKNCKNLTELRIPKSVKSIGERAFEGCENLEIKVDGSVSCAENAFIRCKSVTTL